MSSPDIFGFTKDNKDTNLTAELLDALSNYLRAKNTPTADQRTMTKNGLKIRKALENMGVEFQHLIVNMFSLDIKDEFEKEEKSKKQ